MSKWDDFMASPQGADWRADMEEMRKVDPTRAQAAEQDHRRTLEILDCFDSEMTKDADPNALFNLSDLGLQRVTKKVRESIQFGMAGEELSEDELLEITVLGSLILGYNLARYDMKERDEPRVE